VDAQIASVVWFAVGVAVQAGLVIRVDRTWGMADWGKLAICLVVSASGMLPTKDEAVYTPLNDLLICIGLFGFFLAVLFEKRILPVINEKIVLSYTMVFWYAIFANFSSLGLPDWLIYALLIPTAVTLVIAFAQPALTFPWRVAMYSWFLVLIVSLGLLQFSFVRLAIFYSPDQAPWLSPVECLTTGMAFLYLCVNAAFVFELIPIPGRSQSWEDRMRDWHALTDLMAYRFSDAPSGSAVAGSIFVIEGGVIAANFVYHVIPDGLLVNLLLVLPGLLYFGSRLRPPPPLSGKQAQ
jgi:hypothetical protein